MLQLVLSNLHLCSLTLITMLWSWKLCEVYFDDIACNMLLEACIDSIHIHKHKYIVHWTICIGNFLHDPSKTIDHPNGRSTLFHHDIHVVKDNTK